MTLKIIAALVFCVLAGGLAFRIANMARHAKREGRILSRIFMGRPIYSHDDPKAFQSATRLHWFAAIGAVLVGLSTVNDILTG